MIVHTLSTREEVALLIQLKFKHTDVLTSERDRVKRKAKILVAQAIESRSKGEVILTMEDQHCQRKIKSRIIASGDDRVVLERGISLPIQCISDVEFLN